MSLLKQGEYDTWRLRIESYIQLQDYALWEIIEEGNSFKLVKLRLSEVKRSVISSSNSGSQNLAFLSGHSSTNDVNTANVHVSTGSTPELTRNPRSQENRSRNQDSSRRTMNVEETSSKAMLAIDGVGFDWSFMSEEKTPTNFALMAFSDSEGTGQREVRLVWNNAMRTNHQNFSNSRSNFAPTAVLTKSGLVPISTARQNSSRTAATVSAARPIKTVAPKPFVNVAKARLNAFQKVKNQQSLLSPNTHLLLLHHLNHNPLHLNQHITITSSPHPQEPQIPQTTSSMPHDLPLPGGYTPGSVEDSILETELKKTKEVHGKALTKLVKKVKRLEDKLKSTNKRKKAKIVISDEEEELVSEDSSKQGRIEETEYADVEEENAGVEYDFDLTEQQVTPLKTLTGKDYNRRRRILKLTVILLRIFSTAEDIQNTNEELAKNVQEEEQTKVLEQQEQERANLEAALNLQKLFDQERKAADDIAWSKIVEQAQLKIKEKFRSVEPTEDMERALWVDLKRINEPDKEDTLWKLQRYMHDPLTWRLYGSFAIHHVFLTRGHCIYMLPKKDYPLKTAVMMLMLSRRLQVEEE
ncbi:hypothetical protein Tco_1041935 [Tanacetum coccineum]|uniref:Uncharacterized protein n=1 Tax=Tanacetum coccineum TaxID=301880 RepID=A0ABQ5GIX3_9ASTR